MAGNQSPNSQTNMGAALNAALSGNSANSAPTNSAGGGENKNTLPQNSPKGPSNSPTKKSAAPAENFRSVQEVVYGKKKLTLGDEWQLEYPNKTQVTVIVEQIIQASNTKDVRFLLKDKATGVEYRTAINPKKAKDFFGAPVATQVATSTPRKPASPKAAVAPVPAPAAPAHAPKVGFAEQATYEYGGRDFSPGDILEVDTVPGKAVSFIIKKIFVDGEDNVKFLIEDQTTGIEYTTKENPPTANSFLPSKNILDLGSLKETITEEHSNAEIAEAFKNLRGFEFIMHGKDHFENGALIGTKFDLPDLDVRSSMFLLEKAGIMPDRISIVDKGTLKKIAGEISVDALEKLDAELAAETDPDKRKKLEAEIDRIEILINRDDEQKLSHKLNVDTGGFSGLEVQDDGTVLIDNHGEQEFPRSSAGVLYDKLVELQMLPKTEQMDRFIKFVDDVDNLSYPEVSNARFFRHDYAESFYGIADEAPVKYLYEKFQDKKFNPKDMVPGRERDVIETEKAKINTETGQKLYAKDGTIEHFSISEMINFHKKNVEKVTANIPRVLEDMAKRGIENENVKLGKVLFNFVEGQNLLGFESGLGAKVAYANGFDTYILYNAKDQTFFASSKKDIFNIGKKFQNKMQDLKIIRGHMLTLDRASDAHISESELLKNLGIAVSPEHGKLVSIVAEHVPRVSELRDAIIDGDTKRVTERAREEAEIKKLTDAYNDTIRASKKLEREVKDLNEQLSESK